MSNGDLRWCRCTCITDKKKQTIAPLRVYRAGGQARNVSNVNVYIFIHEKHEIGSTITNSMVSVVLPWKTGFKYINGTYDMNMSKVLPI